jgi:N-acyl-D-amino-acid deacylase
MDFDVLVTGGGVLDGSGSPAAIMDVGIRAGRIEALGDLSGATAATVIDAGDRIVAPGFIDVHCHTDLSHFMGDDLLAVKSAGVRQGVTTEVAGNCGTSVFPLGDEPVDPSDPFLAAMSDQTPGYFPTLAAYRQAMAGVAMIANVAPLVGHGRVRSAAMGDEARAPRDDELARMLRLVEQAMDDGAFGLSTGLIYAPGVYAQTQEVIALSRVAARYGRPYTTHMRDEGDGVVEAVQEALRIGAESGAAVQISHHKVSGRRNWGRSSETLAAIETARSRGVDVTIDVYPYTAGSTFLSALLPPWVLDGGPAKMLQRLADREVRRRIEQNYRTGIVGWQNLIDLSGWDSVVVAGAPPRAGRSIAEMSVEAGVPEVDLVAEILIEDPATLIMIHMMDAAEVDTIADQPFAMIGSDGIPLPGMQHPRLAGTFARTLARHRDDPVALADAVRRMTSLPAQRFGLGDRGVIATGKSADLVVFDPATVSDRATYEQPLLPPAGVDHVIVAGQVVVSDGQLTQARPGRVLAPV